MSRPTWMTVADGRGLELPESYAGPARRKADGWPGVHLGEMDPRWGVVYSMHTAKLEDSAPTLAHTSAYLWLLDLDRPEGFNAAVRKLAHRFARDGVVPLNAGLEWFRSSGNVPRYPKGTWMGEFNEPDGSFTLFHGLDTEDPKVALALALADLENR